MKRLYWHLMKRLYEARSTRASRLAARFAWIAEKYFRRLRAEDERAGTHSDNCER